MTKVRIMGDSRENERRINEEVNRQGRRQKLLYEAESSARQNAAVAMKWSALFDKEIPQELLAEVPFVLPPTPSSSNAACFVLSNITTHAVPRSAAPALRASHDDELACGHDILLV